MGDCVYNEILNILLFHEYVKENKKLFGIYKKIKDAINKGYEFKKNKKTNENKMGKIMKNNTTHFAINKKTNKILESWNYDGYDHDELKNYKDEYFTKDIKINFPFLNENNVVVDSCLGSGTTAVACIETNRHFIGYEVEKKYFDIANDRIKSVTDRLSP